MEIVPPPVQDDNQPPVQNDSPDVQVDTQDDNEWAEAQAEVFGDLSGVKKEEDNQPAPPENKPENKPEDKPEDNVPPAPQDENSPNPPEDKPDDKKEEAPPVENSLSEDELKAIAQRVASRHTQAAIESAKMEIKAKIMPQLPELKASDGFVVKSAKDLETIENPNTPGQAFTPQEAERVFGEYQQQLRQIESQAEARATKIATVNQELMDEATLAIELYKDVFKENPELQRSVYAAYQKTLKLSPEGLIEDAPVSLLEFYSGVMSPYVKMKQSQPTQAQPQGVPQTQTDSSANNERRHQDRSDIYKPSTTNLSKEDQEWADAAKEVFGS